MVPERYVGKLREAICAVKVGGRTGDKLDGGLGLSVGWHMVALLAGI